MQYYLNKKQILKIMAIHFGFLVFLLIIDSLFFIQSDLTKTKLVLSLLRVGIPFFILFTAIIGLFQVLYLNIRILLYKTTCLNITSDYLIYDSYLMGKIKITRQNIERIYTTNGRDYFLTNSKYLAVVTKEPIKYPKQKKDSYLRKNSYERLFYINVSELNENCEKIAYEVEEILNIPIKKKPNNLYFSKF